MLALRNNQSIIWEQILTKELQVLPEELQRIDKLLYKGKEKQPTFGRLQ